MDPEFKNPLGAPIENENQARQWILQLVDRLETERRTIDLISTVAEQKRGYDAYRMRFGQALGVLTALQRCGRLGDVAYNELRARIFATGKPTFIEADPDWPRQLFEGRKL